tara:strand:- start:45 stop:965 length:921 start_codon:yes stop_codon:yes gene_type:complete
MAKSLGKIAIIGAGAIGGYYGALLARKGHDVHFLFRSDFDVVKREGLLIRQNEGEDFTIKDINTYRETQEIGPVDLVIIAIKATGTNELGELLAPLVHDKTVILTLQNGLGNAEFLAEKFNASNVIGGLCFTCINRINPGVIHSIYHGTVRIAEFKGNSMERVNAISEVLKKSEIKCAGSPSLNEILWKKLCWNIPFNGLSIVSGGITTDRILEDKELYESVRSLMREVQLIAKAYGIEILDEFLDKQVEITYPMGPYKPSSLIDFLNKRPVEVEAIFGEPLRRAQAENLPTPHLAKLYASLRTIA